MYPTTSGRCCRPSSPRRCHAAIIRRGSERRIRIVPCTAPTHPPATLVTAYDRRATPAAPRSRARAAGRHTGDPGGRPRRTRHAPVRGPDPRSRLRASGRTAQPGLHARGRRVARHPDRLQHDDLHSRRRDVLPATARRASGAARRRLDGPARGSLHDDFLSGLPGPAGGERRVHGHGRARPDGRSDTGGRGYEPRHGRDGDPATTSSCWACSPSAAVCWRRRTTGPRPRASP